MDASTINPQFVAHPAGRETDWFVAVVSLTPGGGLARYSGVPRAALAQGAGRYRGVMLGAGSSTLHLQGRIARLQVFRRALDAGEVEALHLALSREYGIAD